MGEILKKILYLILIVLILPFHVQADSLYLEELTILNGELSLPFEPLNNEYTVSLAKEEYHIELEYRVSDGINVSVIDNYDLQNDSVVTLLLANDNNKIEYHLHVLKEEEEQTLSTFKEEINEIDYNFMFKYKMYIIPTVCLCCIFITYKILFKKHKNKII